jgi:sortase (surface protein transpeptidase)
MIALLLLIGGTSAVVVALTRRHSPAPRPAASAARRVEPTSTTKSPTPRTTSSKPKTHPAPSIVALDYSTPTAISVPAIGIQSVLTRLDRNPDGTVQVPTSFHVAGWYQHSVSPGQIGPTVILGHVDSMSGPGIFYRVGALHPGDTVAVTRTDGKTVTFVITGVRQYSKTAFPTLDVYGNTPVPTIRLVTCGGAFDSATHHYLSNIVAFGELADR